MPPLFAHMYHSLQRLGSGPSGSMAQCAAFATGRCLARFQATIRLAAGAVIKTAAAHCAQVLLLWAAALTILGIPL